MEGAGIFDGDIAVVNRSITAEHGHNVIAAVNCEPVCKRLCKRGPNIILMSENVGYPTDDVRLMTKAAVAAVDRVFRPGFKYSKAKVLLVNLSKKESTPTISFRYLNQKPQRKSWAFWMLSMASGEGGQCAWPVFRPIRIGGCVETS